MTLAHDQRTQPGASLGRRNREEPLGAKRPGPWQACPTPSLPSKLPSGPPLRRSSLSTLSVTSAPGLLRELSAPQLKQEGQPGRRLQAAAEGRARLPRTRSRTLRDVNSAITGATAALEGDQRYQQELLAEFKERHAEDLRPEAVRQRQLCQFYDFLLDESGNLLPEAMRYIKEPLGHIDEMEAEMRRGCPEYEMGEALEISAKQKEQLRQVLKLCAEASKPVARVGEVLYRPTFCRFLVDAGLVHLEDCSKNSKGYHEAVRLFDAISRAGYNNGRCLNFSAMRMASVDQCVAAISLVLGQRATDLGQRGTQETWKSFEKGLMRAQRTAEALLHLGQRRGDEAKRSEQEALHHPPKERRHAVAESLVSGHSAPPLSFSGTLDDWSKGLLGWVSEGGDSAEEGHAQRHFAVECFVRDSLLEPGCVHVSAAYRDVFAAFFAAYADEHKHLEAEKLRHMSFAAFFRFCLDLGVFPRLCSFQEAWRAYRSADCLQPLGEPEAKVAEKLWRASKRASMMHRDSLLEVLQAPPEPVWESGSESSSTESDEEVVASLPQLAKQETISSTPSSEKEPPTPTRRTLLGGKPAVKQAPRRSSASPASQTTASSTPAGIRRLPSKLTVLELPHRRRSSTRPREADDTPSARLKAANDFSWVRKLYSEMSERELAAYSLLSALDDCVADRLLNVRGLLKASGVKTNRHGLVDAQSLGQFLESLRVKHSLSSRAELASFMRLLDSSDEKHLDPAELEKAVGAVRADLKRRGFAERSPYAPLGGSRHLLCEEARHLSDRATRFGDPSIGEVKAAFGLAAFVEALFLIALTHMHKDGRAIKSAAPAGVKCLWLMSFLHWRFERLLKEKAELEAEAALRKETVAACEEPLKPAPLDPLSQASTRPATREGNTLEPLSPASTRPATREAVSRQGSSALSPGFRSRGRLSVLQTSEGLHTPGHSPRRQSPRQSPRGSPRRRVARKAGERQGEGALPPASAGYSSCLQALLGQSPGLFAGAGGPAAALFCHRRSGVDARPLKESLLYPVFERRRMRWELKELRNRRSSTQSARTEAPSEGP